ncbi:hypothetical protein FCV25MIE_35097 [Fagus crenata]
MGGARSRGSRVGPVCLVADGLRSAVRATRGSRVEGARRDLYSGSGRRSQGLTWGAAAGLSRIGLICADGLGFRVRLQPVGLSKQWRVTCGSQGWRPMAVP